MIRHLTTLALLLCTGCGLAEGERDEDNKRIYLTFYDHQFESFCLEQFDLNGDERISRYEAQRVLTLDCSDRQIESLDDLREFTRLQHLVCSNNQLRTLDLTACVQLESVVCSSCGLTSLNIDGLRTLTDLRCDNNRIESLNLSQNSSLRELDCRNNAMRTLDVSACSRTPKRIDCRTCEQLETLYCLSSQRDAVQSDGITEVITYI